MQVDAGGIILGGNVTFRDMVLSMRNPVRNAVIANGYSLTMNNVTSTSAYSTHIFCGGISEYGETNAREIPQLGNHGRVTIMGSNQLGNIYAGSLAWIPDNGIITLAKPNPNNFPVRPPLRLNRMLLV